MSVIKLCFIKFSKLIDNVILKKRLGLEKIFWPSLYPLLAIIALVLSHTYYAVPPALGLKEWTNLLWAGIHETISPSNPLFIS